MEKLQVELIRLLQIIIGGVISVAGAYATIYIKKAIALAKEKSETIQDEKAKNLVNNTLEKVDDLIETNIIAAENTMKPAILQAIADGKVDKSELNSLAIIVKKNVLNQLGKDATEVFNSSLNDSNGYLTNRIEKILAELKNTDGTEVNKTVIATTAEITSTGETVQTARKDENITNTTVGISASSKIIVDNPDNDVSVGAVVNATSAVAPN